jgi:starvation-inducible DNA-binding protein
MANAALKVAAPTLKPSNGLDDGARDAIASKLAELLADTSMLFLKTQGVHWNVAGPTFFGIHKLTEEQYENLHLAIDEIAERIRSIGREAPATPSAYADLTKLGELDTSKSAAEMVRTLIDDNETIARSIRSAIPVCEDRDDYVSADLLTQRLAWHEKADWMLRALVAE